MTMYLNRERIRDLIATGRTGPAISEAVAEDVVLVLVEPAMTADARAAALAGTAAWEG